MFIKILENLYKMLYNKKYCKIKNTICLFFSKTFISKRFLFLKNPNKKIKKFEELKYHTEWKIFETENKKEMLTDKLEIHIIELEKIEENNQESNDKLLDWLYFLINPDSRRVKEKMEENKELKEAKEKLDKITEDARMQQLAWWREKAIYEENTMLSSSYRKGRKEGEERRNKRNKFKECKENERKKYSD